MTNRAAPSKTLPFHKLDCINTRSNSSSCSKLDGSEKISEMLSQISKLQKICLKINLTVGELQATVNCLMT